MSGTAYATIADNVSRGIRAASKNNLICAGFAKDFTRTLRSFRRAVLNPKMSASLGFSQGVALFLSDL
jgi:hypothetical protein